MKFFPNKPSTGSLTFYKSLLVRRWLFGVASALFAISAGSGDWLASGAGTTGGTAPPPPPVLAPGLIAHWTFDDGTGTDSSGNGNHGTVNGASSSAGKIGPGSLDFDGVDDHVAVPNLDLTGTALTFIAWINSDDLANCRSSDCRIVSQATGVQEQDHTIMVSTIRSGSGVKLRFRLKIDGTTHTVIGSTGLLSNNLWSHIAATYDGSLMRVFLNGAEVGNTSATGGITGNPAIPFWIGGNPDSPTSRPWDGRIDDARLLDHALTPAEIQTELLSGPIAHWTFDDGTGTDSSGNGHHGVVNGAVPASGQIGAGSLDFDGVDDHVAVPNLDLSGPAISLTAWVNSDNLGNCGSSDCRIASQATGSGERDHTLMVSTVRDGGDVKLRFTLDAGGSTTTLVASSGVLVDGQWFHVAATYDGSRMRLYLNGIEVGNTSKSGPINGAPAVQFWIGGNPDSPTSRPWDGRIDDVKLFGNALLPAQIQSMMLSNPFAHWTFDDGTGTDSSGNGNHGVVNGALPSPGRVGAGSLDFDGQDDHVAVEDLNLSGPTISLTAWFNSDDLANCGSSDCRIASQATGSGTQDHIFMVSTIRSRDGVHLRFRLKTAGSTSTLIAPSGPLGNGGWHHVAATYDGAHMRLFLDGDEVGSRPNTGLIDSAPGVPFWIGGNPPDPDSRPWDGKIDDVKLFRHSLLPFQIQELLTGSPVIVGPPSTTTAEDTPVQIVGLGIGDAESAALELVMSVLNGTITVLPMPGVAIDDNSTGEVRIAGTIAELETALNDVIYLPDADFHGPDQLTVRALDGLIESLFLSNIVVLPTNDAPTLSGPGLITTDEDVATEILGLLIEDVEDDQIDLILKVLHGSIFVLPSPGVDIDNNSSAEVELRGTTDALADALTAVHYTPEPDFNGDDELSVKAIDGLIERFFLSNIVVLLTADDPDLTDLSIDPLAPVLQVGESTQLTVTGELADGTTKDVTPASEGTTFDNTNPNVVTVDENGLVTGRGIGNASIFARNSGIDAFVPVRVFLGVPTAVVITPATPIVKLGDSVQLQVTAELSTGASVDVTPSALGTTYLSTDSGIASVSAEGLLTGNLVGNTTVSATNAGVTAVIPVEVSTLNLVPVGLPDLYEVNAGGVLEIVAPGVLDNDNDPENLPLTATLSDDASNGDLDLLPDGSFSYVPFPGFASVDQFKYIASDGTLDSLEILVEITVIPPLGPSVIDLLASSDSGNSDSDDVTSDSTPTVRVEGLPTETVRLFLDGVLFESQTGVLNPEFTLPPQIDGPHVLETELEGPFGELRSSPPLPLLIDTLPPQLLITSPPDGATVNPSTRLTGLFDGSGSDPFFLTHNFNGLPPSPLPFSPGSGLFDQPLGVELLPPGPNQLRFDAEDQAGNTAIIVQDLVIDPDVPFTITAASPNDGATDIGLTFKPQVFFSTPVDPSTLNNTNFFASSGGLQLPASIVPSIDGTFAWLFFTNVNPLPDSAAIEITVDGSTILSEGGGLALDADQDGAPGGIFAFSFSTVSVQPIAQTTLTGFVVDPGPDLTPHTADDVAPGPDGVLHTPDDVFLLPIAGVDVHIIGLQAQGVLTGPDGAFLLDQVPAGNVKLVVDGLTATSPPPDFYFPEMVMEVNVLPGQVNFAMPGMPEMYLPRIATEVLQTVESVSGALIVADDVSAPDLPPAQRSLLTLDIQPNSLIGPDGQPLASADIGISTVPPELVRDMLPPGVLQHTFDITVQAPGVGKFAVPAAMTFPNVFNAPPGSVLNYLSFDHDSGQLEIEGTATVSADGKTVVTDPGTGITRPGWHGMTPPGGCGGSGGRPPDPPPPDPDEVVIMHDAVNVDLDASRFGDTYIGFGKFVWNSPPLPPGADPPPPTPPGGCGVPNHPDFDDGTFPFTAVFIEVDGPLAKFAKTVFKSDVPLQSQAFTLFPGSNQKKTLFASGQSWRDMFAAGTFQQLFRDQLYGAQVKVTEIRQFNNGDRRRDIHTYRMYRWIPVVDPGSRSRGGPVVAFHKTLANGGLVGDGFVRDKFVDMDLPRRIPTSFSGPLISPFDANGPYRGKVLAEMNFDPTSTGNRTSFFDLKADGDKIGGLRFEGKALKSTKIDPNIAGYMNELRRVILSLRNAWVPNRGGPGSAGDDDKNGTVDGNEEYGFPGSDDTFEVVYAYEPGVFARVKTVGPDKVLGTLDDFTRDVVDYTLGKGRRVNADDATQNHLRFRVVGPRFKQEFAGFMPNDRLDRGPDGVLGTSDDQFTFGQLVSLNTLIVQKGQELFDAIAADFVPVNRNATAYRIVNSGGDVELKWEDRFDGGSGAPVFGSAFFDADTFRDSNRDGVKLSTLFADNKVTIGAKMLALSNNLNVFRIGSGGFGVGINLNWISSATFAQYVANTVSHEIGHTFGLKDAYRNSKTPVNAPNTASCRAADTNCKPFDIMMSGGAADPDLTFRQENLRLLQAAMGIHGNFSKELERAVKQYRDTINLPGNVNGVREDDESFPLGEDPPEPFLGPEIGLITDESDFFGLDDEPALEIGLASADGPGGEELLFDVELLNVGFGPLTVSSIGFADGGLGLSVVDTGIVGPPIGPGAMATLTIKFDPAFGELGAQSDVLQVVSDAASTPTLEVTVSANAISSDPVAIVELVESNNLGGIVVPGSTNGVADIFSISNDGAAPLLLTGFDSGLLDLLGIPAEIDTTPISLEFEESFTFGVDSFSAESGLLLSPITVATNDPLNLDLALGVVSTGIEIQPIVDWGNDFIAIETPETPGAVVLRDISDDGGNFEFFLPQLSDYHLVIFDPATGLVTHGFGTTPASGQAIDLTASLLFGESIEQDSDFDGLPDDVEFAIGTSPNNPDTDGDGLLDGFEIEQGLDPFGGLSFPTGIIASLPLTGNAREVVVESLDGINDTAYVATGSDGLSIVDVTQFDDPILVGRLGLSGTNTDVAVDATRALAAVPGGANGLHIVDVSDPMFPALVQTVPLPGSASRVEVFDGIAYVTTGTAIVSVDLVTGDDTQTLDLGGATLTDIVRESTLLFTMDTARTLRVIDISGLEMFARGQLGFPTSGGGGRVFVGNGIAYAAATTFGRGGFATADVTDPDNPALISGSDIPIGTQSPRTAIAVNGSGLALLAGIVGVDEMVDLMSVADPANTFSFLTRFDLPTAPNSVHVASGIGFVADGVSGLKIINYLPFDSLEQPPTVTLISGADDKDPLAPGVQVVEGTSIPIKVAVDDDVQVRKVDLLVNGELTTTDVSFPFDFFGIALGSDPGAPTVLLRARAHDSGGNVSLSDELILDLVQDTIPPVLEFVAPADDGLGAEGITAVSVRFDEAISVDSLSASNFVLRDSASDIVLPTGIEFRNNDRGILMSFDPLPADVYTLTIVSSGITDRAGNQFGLTDIVTSFTLVETTIFWIGDSGNWNDVAHWSTGVLPGPADDVFIGGASGLTVTHNAGTANVNSIIGDATLVQSGGTLIMAQESQIERLTHSGGTLTGGGDLTVKKQSTWTGGTLTGGGKLIIPVGSKLSISGSTVRFENRTIDNFGTTEWSGGSSGIWSGQGATFNNQPGGLFDVKNDHTISNNLGGTKMVINNSGTFRKSAGGGSTTLQVTFNNNQDVEVQTGTLRVDGLGSSTGSFDADFGATLRFANSYTANLGTSFNGAGITRLLGGTFSIGGTATGNDAITVQNLQLATTLSGSGDLEINPTGVMTWTGGTLTGGGDLTVPVGATLSISGSTVRFENRTINNFGETRWSGGGSGIWSGQGAIFNNQPGGLFDIQNDHTISNNLGGTKMVFNNSGTFRKSLSGGTTTLQVTFNNNQDVEVQTGTLRVDGLGASTATFDVATGATLRFANSYSANLGTNFPGPGLIRLTGGTFSISAAATGADAITVQNLQLATTLSGSGDLEINPTGVMNWTTGTLTGGGDLIVPVGAKLLISSSTVRLENRTIENFGTTEWSGGGSGIWSGQGAVFNNQPGGLFDIKNDHTISNNLGGVKMVFNNSGTFRKNGGAGTTTIQVTFNNNQDVEVQTGILRIDGLGASTATFDVDTGATLRFANSYTANLGTNFPGSGLIRLTGGTFSISAGATGPDAITVQNLQLATTLSGSGDLEINPTGVMNWTSGTLTGGGDLIVPVDAKLLISGTTVRFENRTIDNFGTTEWSGGSSGIWSGQGAVFNNQPGGLFDIKNDQTLSNNLGGTKMVINNSGTFRKSAGGGSTTIQVTFNNNQDVEVQTGTLRIDGLGASTANFDVASGATLRFANSYTANLGTSFTGVGITRLVGGTFSIGGTAVGPDAVTALNLELSTTLSGSGELTIEPTGVMTWTSGTLTGGGKLIIPVGAKLSISGSTVRYENRTVDNFGTTEWSGGGSGIWSGQGAVFNNLSGGLFDAQNDQTISNNLGGTTMVINNSGTFRKSAGVGTTTIQANFDNTGGTIEEDSGTINFTGACVGC